MGARVVLVAALSCALLAVGCKSGDDDDADHDHDSGSEEGDHDKPIGTPSGAVCPENSDLTYDSFGKAFMDKYCVRCHSSKLTTPEERMGATPDHDFDVYEGILGVAEHVDQFAAAGPGSVNTTMPPTDPKPTMEEREKLGQWLACELDMLE